LNILVNYSLTKQEIYRWLEREQKPLFYHDKTFDRLWKLEYKYSGLSNAFYFTMLVFYQCQWKQRPVQ